MFHPVVAAWFERRFGRPTPVQALRLAGDRPGRRRAADRAHRLGQDPGGLPLLPRPPGPAGHRRHADRPDPGRLRDAAKALSNDVKRNLEDPLAEIVAAAREAGHAALPLRSAVRTGDTTMAERRAAVQHPPHILVTTPESLFILLTSESGRRGLRHVRTVIVDEIHALVGDKRGRPPGAVARAARPAGARGQAAADRPVGHGAADGGGQPAAGAATGPPPPWSTPAASATWTWTSRCWRTSWARSAPTSSGARSTTGWPTWPASTDRRWSSSTPAGWSSGWRCTWASGWGRGGGRPPRQPVARAALLGRAAAQERPAQGHRGHRLARAGHRRRRGRPGLPDRLAALDRHRRAARGPLGPRRGRHAQGALLPADPRPAGASARRWCGPPAAGSSTASPCATRRWTSWPSRSSPRAPPRSGTRTRCSPWCRRAAPYAEPAAGSLRRGGRHAVRGDRHQPRPRRRAAAPRRASTGGCAAGGAPAWRP